MEIFIVEATNALLAANILREGISRKEVEDILINVLAKLLEI